MERKSGVNASLIRQLNVARVFHALRLHPDSSQRELAKLTGLDKATISAVVGVLEADGLLERSGRASSARPGRPQVALSISDSAGALLGARLEPNGIRLIATTLSGERIVSLQAPGSLRVETAVTLLGNAVDTIIERADLNLQSVRGMGVGIPALMSEGGQLVLAPNLHWQDVAVKEMLQPLLPFPVYVDNDTKAAALAEKLFGACRDVRDFVFIAGHSGVGGGLYLGGSLYRGRSGFAGEVGHLKVRRGGRLCGCGARGCLEAYVSEAAILLRLAEFGVELADLHEVAAAAAAGEKRVLRVLSETGEILGEACANLVNLLDPERIVLGGNLSLVAPYLLPVVDTVLDREALWATRADCQVLVSPLGTEAVPMGGVALALEGVLSLPSWLAASELRDLLA